MGDVFGSPFNRAYFERNNVFYFARSNSAASLKRMKIYFNVGNNDDYGFEAGCTTVGPTAEIAGRTARVSRLSWGPRRAVRGSPLRRRDPMAMEYHRGRELAADQILVIAHYGTSTVPGVFSIRSIATASPK